jgi:DNA adenine methylase
MDNSACYFEPFLGAGSLYFKLAPRWAVLGDLNPTLVECYREIRDHPDRLCRHMASLGTSCNETSYKLIREEFNDAPAGSRRAALFLYLNRTCFNGIWRVNKQGNFNVPFGQKTSPSLPSFEELRPISELLKGSSIVCDDFVNVCTEARSGDFVYLDPPYLPLTKTASFTHYTLDRFGLCDHERVLTLCEELDRRGVNFMLSTGEAPPIPKMFRGFSIETICVCRRVGANGKCMHARELVVRNYS